MPFETAWLTRKAGSPTAMSSSYLRTSDSGPNRLLRHAFEKLLARYIRMDDQPRTLRLWKALARLSDVQPASISDLTPLTIAGYFKHLPTHHAHYADALRVASLIVYDSGLSIRQSGGIAMLPSMLIKMATVFERYVRRVLVDGFADNSSIQVKDGNNEEGGGGAKRLLYDPIQPGFQNSFVTPDIVIEANGNPVLIIDAKYKPAPDLPKLDDVRQAIVYGARYATSRIMLLHASRPTGRASVEQCGSIGGFDVYNGMIDLSAISIENEEDAFVAATRNLVQT